MRIKCSKKNCTGIIAHASENGLIEIKRKDQLFKIIGSEFSILASCPNTDCQETLAIHINGKKLQKDGLIIEN
jgi:hypothetical protein